MSARYTEGKTLFSQKPKGIMEICSATESTFLFGGLISFFKILEKNMGAWSMCLLYFALTIDKSEGSVVARSKISSSVMEDDIYGSDKSHDFPWSVSIAGSLVICLGLILCSFSRSGRKNGSKSDGGCVIRPPEACGETSTHTVYTSQAPIMSAIPVSAHPTKTEEDVLEPVQQLHEKPQELLLPDLQPAALGPDSPIINLQNQEQHSESAFSYPHLDQPFMNTQRQGSILNGQPPFHSLPPVMPSAPAIPPVLAVTTSAPQVSNL